TCLGKLNVNITNGAVESLVPTCGKRGAQIDPHGFDAGKLIKGKKRHVVVDALGLLLHALITPGKNHKPTQ
ncbi:MAG TPA: transposase, partial [Verrucomicrobiae bacterium]|nr:transposase [Verrucomicrobiae bacterium]